MNPIEELREYVKRRHPKVVSKLTPPLHRGGVWSLDIDVADKQLAIEWSEVTSFAVSTVTAGSFGERPDESVKSVARIKRRVTQLLTTSQHTVPPYSLPLAGLRERMDVTQQELARRLGVRQATVSAMEHRDDIQLSTLRRIVVALNGSLEILAHFTGGTYRIKTYFDGDGDQKHLSKDAQMPKKDMGRSACPYNDAAFSYLKQAGCSERVAAIANNISLRHAVIEMP